MNLADASRAFMSSFDTEFATASPRRLILFVALSPEDAQRAAEGLKKKSRRWRLAFAPTTADAVQQLRGTPFDCVVMNLQARGIDPHRFFKEVMETSPEALRIGLTEPDERRSLQQSGAPVHQFLSRPLDPMILTAVLARAFAGQDFLLQEHFRKLVDSITSLPVLPAAYSAVMAELNSTDPSLERIGELIATDLGLSAKVLQLVNSAFFGLARPIAHPSEAATFLGTETIKSLVLALSVFSQFSLVRLKEFDPEELWQHCWTTGAIARRLCEFEETERAIADEAFMAGLLHDMGKLILAANYPALLEQNMAEAARKKIGLWEQEFLVHGASHAELGGFILRRWGLPQGVIDAVTFHHRPMLARIRTFSAVTAVHLANTLPRLLSPSQDSTQSTVDLGYLRALGLEERLEEWKQIVGGQLERCGVEAA
jgi:putative nucleotidyltransferase with HDIG domain